MKSSPSTSLDIEGIDKARLLVELYNAAKVDGRLWLKDNGKQMTYSKAQQLLNRNYEGPLDSHNGKILKIVLKEDSTYLDSEQYDSINGTGLAASIVSKIRGGGGVGEFKPESSSRAFWTRK